MKRIYISGPMSGLPENNFPAFHAAAASLRAVGYEAVNPAEINADATLTWEQCLRADIRALCDCDTVALLPGWEDSKGAHLEVHVAHRLGIKVVRIEEVLATDGATSIKDMVGAELARAVMKFPTWPTDPLHAIAVLGEEFGELTKAVVQTTYEPDKSSHQDVMTEAVQTAAMALRFLISLGQYKYARSTQHKQPEVSHV